MVAALLVVGSAAVLFLVASPNVATNGATDQFVRQRGGRFFVGQKPFRFVGANVALMYRDEDRARMPETLRQAAQVGIKVVRVWGCHQILMLGKNYMLAWISIVKMR